MSGNPNVLHHTLVPVSLPL